MNELSKIEGGSDLAQTSGEVRRDLERSRAKVTASVEALRHDLKSSVADLRLGASELTSEIKRGAQQVRRGLNWKVWAANNPWGFVAGAFVVGIYLGARRRS